MVISYVLLIIIYLSSMKGQPQMITQRTPGS